MRFFDDFADDAERQALEQGNALDQRRFERDLAVHGARRDRRDLVLQARFRCEFVDTFLADHGGIHIGDQKFLAARLGVLDDDIDGGIADDAAQQRFLPVRIGAVLQGDIAGHAVGQPIEAGCIDGGCGLFGKRWGEDGI